MLESSSHEERHIDLSKAAPHEVKHGRVLADSSSVSTVSVKHATLRSFHYSPCQLEESFARPKQGFLEEHFPRPPKCVPSLTVHHLPSLAPCRSASTEARFNPMLLPHSPKPSQMKLKPISTTPFATKALTHRDISFFTRSYS